MRAYVKIKTDQKELEGLNVNNENFYTQLGKLFNIKVDAHSIYVKQDKSMEIELEGKLINS